MKIYAGTYDDITDSAIIIITAGANQKPGETRLDLVHKNVAIYKSIIPEISRRDFQGILLIVSNPVDILTYTALKLSGFPENRVIGSGTVLDTARLKYALSEHLGVDSRSVHSFIIGEHGDSEIAAWSSTNVSGIPLNTFCEMRGHYNHDAAMDRIAEEVKNSAYDIISKKQATYYGIAMSVKRICECIIRNERSILPISSMMHGEYARLAGGVVHLAGVAPEAHHAGEVHDPAVPLLHHDSGHGLHAQEGAFQVGVDHRVEVGLLHHHHKAVPGDAGIVHQNVNPAEFLHSGIHQGLHLGLVRHVALHGQGLGTQVLASGHGLLGSFRPAGVAQHHIGAAPGQLLADGPADAPAGTGNESGSLHDLDLLMGDFQRTFPSIANFLKKRKKTVDKRSCFMYHMNVPFRTISSAG